MKKHFLHLNRLAGLLVVCLALTACDPNPDPDDSGTVPPPPPNGKRLVSMTKDKGGHQVYTDVFEYNSKGQIIRVDDKTNSILTIIFQGFLNQKCWVFFFFLLFLIVFIYRLL